MKLKHRIIVPLIVFIPSIIFGQLGSIDSTFNVMDSGPVQVYFESSAQLQKSHIFNDGSIITVGEFTSFKNQTANRIVRFDFNSNVDQSFQSNIGSGADSTIKQILVLQNGKIFLAGDFSSFNSTPCNGTVLLNSDGTMDNGYLLTVNTGIINFRSVVEQNSNIIISGHTSLSPITSTLVRIDQSGSIDPSFSASSPVSGTPNYGEVVVDSQNRIYLNGSFNDMDGHVTPMLARLLPDGNVDVSFSSQPASITYGFFAIDIDLNDQVIFRNSNVLNRLNDDGSIDTTFNCTVTFIANSNGFVGAITAIKSMPDSTYFVSTTDSRILKFNSQGASSTDFIHIEESGGYARDLNIFPSGKLLITRPNNLFVLQSNGWRDAAFQTTTGATGKITAVTTLPDGKTLIAGDFYGYNNENIQTVARILSDGNIDASFDSGFTLRQSSSASKIWSIEPQLDGKILIGGNFPTFEAGVSSPTWKQVIRLLANGERDTTFNEIIFSSGAFGSRKLIVLGDGSFFTIGQNIVRKYHADGQLDNGFSILGVSGFGGTIHDAHILPTGKLLVGGLFSIVNGVSANSLVRINPDGTIDNTFSSGSGTAIYAIDSQSDGKVLLSGLGYNGGYNGNNFGYLFRVHENGDFDTTFVLDSIYGFGYNYIPKIRVTHDDKIWVLGSLGSPSQTQNSGGGVVRLDTNGIIDTNQVFFLPIWSTNDIKFDIQPSNNIIIGGWFGEYGYVYKRNLTRIIGDTSTLNCQFFTAQFDYIEDLSCSDTSNSVAGAVNGTPPYIYSWDNQGWNQNDTLFTTSNGGTHFLSISDSVGCSYSTGFLINGPSNQVAPDNFVNMVAWPFRPGFNTKVKINAGNKGCILSSGQLMVVHDSLLSFNFANPFMPNSIQGDTLIWNFQDLHIDSANLLFTLNFQTSVNAQIGDSINFEVEIDSLGIDYNVSDNSKEYWYPVVNGYDPNDKSVYPKGECIPNFVNSQEKLEYTVRFQNTGNSYAVNINIVDSLPSDLDLSTLSIVSTSHPMYTEIKQNNVVHFRFDNIYLPDSSSNPDGSLGFVTFQIDQNNFVYQGSEIRNKAHIFFDFNPAIITNEVLNTVSNDDYHFIGDTSVVTEIGSYQWGTDTYTTSGLYSFNYFNQFGCDSVVYLDLTILPNTTGIYQSELDKIELVPNPNNGIFKIVGANNSVITVYDRLGNRCLSNKPVSNSIVNLSDVNSGIYFVKIESSQGVIVKKVLVQH